MKAILVAYADNRVIGDHGDIPWMGKMPADMKRVRDLTLNNAIIMGRGTFESIGRALPKRQNIVLTSDTEFAADNVEVARDLKQAFQLVDQDKDAIIFGGGKVYAESLIRAEELGIDAVLVTEIHASFDGDAKFPDLNPKEWQETSRQDFPAGEDNLYPYSFVEYRRY